MCSIAARGIFAAYSLTQISASENLVDQIHYLLNSSLTCHLTLRTHQNIEMSWSFPDVNFVDPEQTLPSVVALVITIIHIMYYYFYISITFF